MILVNETKFKRVIDLRNLRERNYVLDEYIFHNHKYLDHHVLHKEKTKIKEKGLLKGILLCSFSYQEEG